MMERKRIFIAVKTYPAISQKYAELVCTAGVLEDGSWIRLYPLPFRRLDIENRFPKYTWIEVDIERNTSDFRPETYRVLRLDNIVVEKITKTKKTPWDIRWQIIFKNKKIYTSLSNVIDEAKSNNLSLAVLKPKQIIDFVIEETEREWNKNKLEILSAESRQLSLFQTAEEIADEFRVVKKVPYRFSYCFIDDSGQESTMMIEDWEIGMLYFHCLERSNGDEEKAVQLVKRKYLQEFSTKDLYFFIGTTKAFHNIAPNPFIIIGVFYPPKTNQADLFGGNSC
jgi:hypothetical protein